MFDWRSDLDLEELIDGIDQKLSGPGRDEDKLSPQENALKLAFEFDDHVRADGFTSFVYQGSEVEWAQTRNALRAVGASGYADAMGRFIDADSKAFKQQGSAQVGSPEFAYSEDYDASLTEASEASGDDDDYMETILLAYAEREGLGQ